MDVKKSESSEIEIESTEKNVGVNDEEKITESEQNTSNTVVDDEGPNMADVTLSCSNNDETETSVNDSSQSKNYKNVILEDWDLEAPQGSTENRVDDKPNHENGDVDVDEVKIEEVVDGITEKEDHSRDTKEVSDVEKAKEDCTETESVDKKSNDTEKELIKPVLDKKKNPLKYSNLIVSNQDIVEILDNSVERVCRPIIPAKDIFLSIELTKHFNQKLGPAAAGKMNSVEAPDGINVTNNNESVKKTLPKYQTKIENTLTNVESKEKEGDESENVSDKSFTPQKVANDQNASDQNKKGKKKMSKKNICIGDEMERTIALRQLRDEFPTTRRRSHTTKKINHIPFLASSVLEKALTSTVSDPVKSGSPRRRPCYLPDSSAKEDGETPKKNAFGDGGENDEKTDKNAKDMKLSDLSNTSAQVVRTYCIKRKSTETEKEVKSALQTFLSASKEFQEGDEENIESKPKKQKTAQQEAQTTGKPGQKKRKLDGTKKRNLELEKLLGDEGAVRMLYETQHKDDNSRLSRKKSRKTTFGLKKDLLLKTKLVKNAVLRLSGASSDGVSLRGKRRSLKSEPESVPDRDEPFATSTPNVILYKPKKKQRAEASRILYRHSSSESFNSDDDSGFRRKSFEGENVNSTNSADSNLLNGELFKEKSASEMEASDEEEANGSGKKWKTLRKAKMVGGKRLKKMKTREGKEANRESFDSQNNAKLVWSNVPVRKSRRPRMVSKKYSIWASTSMDSLSVESLGFKKPKKASQELSKKLNCKELRILQHGNLVQIILSPSSTVLKNSFNELVLTELKEALNFLSERENCSVVLLTSTGTTFCQGIDLNYVLSVEEEDRKTTFGNLLNCLEKLVLCLANYKKPIIAGVHAGAIGLGVTLLAYCDIVMSSDRASFYTPYARLGQVSEGAATFTFPRISKNLATELLYKSERISAAEAMKFGLVSQVIPEERFEEELLLTSRRIASHSMQAMQSIKALSNKNDYEKIAEILEMENQLVLEHWCSNECINNIIKFLNSGEVQFRPLDVT